MFCVVLGNRIRINEWKYREVDFDGGKRKFFNILNFLKLELVVV